KRVTRSDFRKWHGRIARDPHHPLSPNPEPFLPRVAGLLFYPRRATVSDKRIHMSLQQKHSVTIPELGITFSTGTYAALANGAVNVSVGETNVFVTACVAQSMKPGQDFFPLT